MASYAHIVGVYLNKMAVRDFRLGRIEDLIQINIIRRVHIDINPLKEANLSNSIVPEKVP